MMPRVKKERKVIGGAEHQWCSRCKRYLLPDKFSKPYGRCKKCTNKYARQYYVENIELSKERSRQYNLQRAYGISLEEYNALFESQSGGCAICRQPEMAEGKSLAVDHDHTTGEIRGLLCTRCNLVLGSVSDSVAILSSAIDYLETSNETPAC